MADQIKIIYENNDFLIIDKPSGLLTHPANRQDKSESVVGWLLQKYPEIAQVTDKYAFLVGGWADLRPGIVHRLDKETSGLILIAKNQTTFDYLKNLFQERKVKKTYIALTYGHLKNTEGLIDLPIGKLPGRAGGTRQTTRIIGKYKLKEKNAITKYRVLETYSSPLGDYSLLEVSPLTGRTHQIRIHLKSIGHPIVCDKLYAGRRAICPPGLDRMFLHAKSLSFVSPLGKAVSAEAGLPTELMGFLEKLQKIKK
ncbi:MAG: RluA family pseudouridine synthase [Candidatus Yanofskybacteria bacterium]|nr:RluA family pseudouridine synthase [Candidatus Yanofskybacteria bacterium]